MWYSNVKCCAPQVEGGQEGRGVVNVTATSVELTGLRPESTYTISVRAYTADGPGEERRLTVVHTHTHKKNLFVHTVLEGYLKGHWLLNDVT